MLPESAEVFRANLLEWSKDNLREFTWRDANATLYEVFIAEFMLTQTPAEVVAQVHPQFIERYPELEAIKAAREQDLAEILEPVGLYNRRAQALKEIAQSVEEIPDGKDELISLTRVGDYISDATLCFGLGRPQPILDRNVRRIYSRVFGDQWPERVEEQRTFTKEILPTEEARCYNFGLLDFGAAVCKPTAPNCPQCFATDYCTYYDEEYSDDSRESQ